MHTLPSRNYYTNHRHLLLRSPKADTHFIILRKVEGWAYLAGWLRTEMVYLPVDSHLSINQARRRVTSLITRNTLPLRQATIVGMRVWTRKIKKWNNFDTFLAFFHLWNIQSHFVAFMTTTQFK